MKNHAYGIALTIGLSAGGVFAADEVDGVSDAMAGILNNMDYKETSSVAAVPFAFSTDNMGTALGAAGVVHGIGPTKASLVLVGTYSDNDSGFGMAALYNAGFAPESRWRFDVEMVEGRFTESHLYTPGNPAFSGTPTAGSNDSDQDDYVLREQHTKDYKLRAKWLLPLGDGEEGYTLQGNRYGLPLNDGENRPVWNPLASGHTSLDTEFFYKSRDLDKALVASENIHGEVSSGIKMTLDYDNRNAFSSPSAGSRTKMMVTRDWGAGGSKTDYTRVELDYAQYFNLGTSKYFRQQVLAVNAYASDITTWDDDNPSTIPPWFARSTLGGWNHLRGYNSNRFVGRSAVHYSAELRGITRTNLLNESFLGNYYSLPWMELAAFVDAGRVADKWNLDTLHSDMKTNYGVSLRFMVEGVSIRLDTAYGDEGGQLWVFINQPF